MRTTSLSHGIASTMSVPESVALFLSTKVVHRTWAGTFQCKPQAIFQPSTVEEIQELIRQAALHKKTIMTVGSGHSPSDLTMTSEWLCNLDKFDRVLEEKEFFGPGESGPEVKFVDLTVEAGIRIFQLNEYLKKHKLAIQNLGSISDQSIAGLISTGTHGLSPYHGLVSQQVVSLVVANSEGQLITCSSVEKPQLFKAALLSLGKVGIITQVTLRAVPQYTIKSKQEIIRFSTLLREWDRIWLDSEFIRVWWFPYSGSCVCWRAAKSDDSLSEPRQSWYGTPLGRFFYEALLWVLVNIAPRITPWVERFVFRQQYGNVETLGSGDVAVQNSVEGLNMDCLFSQFVNEWSAPLDNGVEILTVLDEKIRQAAEKGDFFVHAPIEVRCSNVTYSEKPYEDAEGKPSLYPSQEWLKSRSRLSAGPIPGNSLRPYLDNSPLRKFEPDLDKVSNEQLSVFINATMYRPFGFNLETHRWFETFEHVMSRADGKPHWAKNFIGLHGEHENDLDLQGQLQYGGKTSYSMLGFDPVMKKWFGENLVKFNEVRREMDPHGVFLSGRAWMVRNGLLLE